MALLFMDSFDHYVTADAGEKWSAFAATGAGTLPTVTIAAGAGRRGSGSFRYTTGSVSSQSGYANIAIPASGPTCVVGVAFSPASLGTVAVNGAQIVSIRNGATVQITLRLNSDHTLSVVRGTHTGTALGSTVTALPVGTFTYLELQVLLHASAGTVDLRINGTSALSLTGQNTVNSGGAVWTSVGLMMQDTTTTSINASVTGRAFDFDDLYVLDGNGAAPWNTFLGDVRVDARLPTGAGALAAWTPSAGANWQNVDDAAPNDDTDYNSAAASALTDTFVVQDAPVPGAALYGVQVNLSAKKSDAGTCSLASVVRQAGSNQVAAAQNPGTSYAYLRTVYQTNPHTSAQWTEADFNADEFGYQRTA